MRTSRSISRAFPIVEFAIVVVILGSLASLAIPRVTSASQQAQANTVKDYLQYLRTQITVYKAQHGEVPPGYPNGDVSQTPDGATFVNQLTQYSTEYGAVSATPSSAFPFGKYLSSIPVNPFNSCSAIWVVTSGTAMPLPDNNQQFGWIYNPQTMDITVNLEGSDSDGVPYSAY